VKICLVSRHFDFRNAGIGRVGMEVEKGLIKEGYSTERVSTNGSSLYSYFFYTALQIPFRLPKADIYHALTPMEAMWLPKKKSVVTFHDLFQITDRSKLGSGLGYSRWKRFIGCSYYEFACRVAGRCKGVTAVSEKTKEDLVEYLGMEGSKIRVIRSGIRQDLTPMRKRDKVFRIGYLGQLDRRKRVSLLIEAFRKSNLDELVVGGTGVDGQMLKEQAGGDERIKFLGRIPDKELVDFYNSLDVFVFPTWLEGYGLPIVEAMACKKPVMVLEDAKIPWEVKKRCIIVDELDYVLGNKEYLEGRCGGIDVESNYLWAKEHSWNKAVSEYIEVYREVLDEE